MMRRFPKLSRFRRQVHSVAPPQLLGNSFLNDSLLPRLTAAIYNQRGCYVSEAFDDLSEFGGRHNELHQLAAQCEMYPPKLQRLDGWGGRVDHVITCSAWKRLHDIASEEGLVSISHHQVPARKQECMTVWQSMKLLLFNASSGMVSCPLAMTAGAAATLSVLLDTTETSRSEGVGSQAWREELQETVDHLTSRDPAKFWTSGQWMTERMGGSDVTSATQTFALRDEAGGYTLHGNKFYTSAIDCDVALALAKCGEELSLFLVRLPEEYDGTLCIEKLKEKLGTRQLPTAELSLQGVPATLLAKRGIANIIPMLQVTRLHNALTASSYLRHVTNMARNFAGSRSAFGVPLNALPLHRSTLARLETTSRALILQSLDLALILNPEMEGSWLEPGVARVLSAVVKIHTALVAVTAIREGLECFGGAGYMEDTGLPGLFRDACVLPVWEGTTDVLSAETVRALARGSTCAQVLQYLRDLAVGTCVFGGAPARVMPPAEELEGTVQVLELYLVDLERATEDSVYTGRAIALGIGAAHSAALLINFGHYTKLPTDIAAAKMWCKTGLVPLASYQGDEIDNVLS